MPAFSEAGCPEHSISASASTPLSSSGTSRTSMVLVAPVRSARLSRCGLTSVTVISVAPKACAHCAASNPIGPAPVTSTRSPALTFAFWHAQTPTESGSMSAPASSETESGSANAKSSWIVT